MLQVQLANGCGNNDHCGMCSGASEGPCPYLCINRVRACLPQHADLSLDWDTFVGQYRIIQQFFL